MKKSDIRAVENPISAIFDLAADVYERAPKTRKLVVYTRAFIYVWLFLDFLVIVAASRYPFLSFLILLVVSIALYSLRWGERGQTRVVLLILAAALMLFISLFSASNAFIVTVLLIILFYLGWIILDLLRDLRKFFDYYVVRHKVIRAVRDADPVVKIPQGPDIVSRLMEYLRASSPEIAHVMSQLGAVKSPAALAGCTGVVHNFDAMVLAQPSPLWSLIGWAYPGWCILVKRFDRPPGLDDLKYLKHAAEDVVSDIKVPPSRVIALWRMTNGQIVTEETYQFVTTQVVKLRHRGDLFLCSLEMIAETEDGTYDLVPFVVQSPR